MIDYLERTAGLLTAAIAFAVLFASTDDFNPLDLADERLLSTPQELSELTRGGGLIRIDLAPGDRA